MIYIVFQLSYGKNSSKKTIEPSKQAHNAKKTKSVKNRIVYVNLGVSNTSVTPKILKNQDDLRNMYIDLLKKEWVFYLSLLKNENYFHEPKSFYFFSKIKQLSSKKIVKALLGTNTN